MKLRAALDGKPVLVSFDTAKRELAVTSPNGFRFYIQTKIPVGSTSMLWDGSRRLR